MIAHLHVTDHASDRLAERAGISDSDWLTLEIGRGWHWRQEVLDRGEPRVLVPLRGGAWALLRQSDPDTLTVVTVLTAEMRRNNLAWGRYVVVAAYGAAGDVTDDGQDCESDDWSLHEQAAARARRIRRVLEREVA